MSRLAVRAMLLVVAVLATGTLFLAIVDSRGESLQARAAATSGPLAVLAALISGWGAQRVIEMQEDAQQPHVVPVLDAESRYEFIQLAVKNLGGSPASNVKIVWKKPLRNSRGEEVSLNTTWLPQGESFLAPVCGALDLSRAGNPMLSEGVIEYDSISGRHFSKPFILNLENALFYRTERTRTDFELQKVPRQLENIVVQLKHIQKTLADSENLNRPAGE